MKFRIELDVSAAEVRQVFGLPDVEQLQRDVIDAIRASMAAGVEGFDPLSLFQSFFALAEGVGGGGLDVLQKLLRQAVRPSAGSAGFGGPV